MIDFIYKLFLKGLPQWLYRVIHLSSLGRVKNWEKFETHKSIFENYKRCKPVDFANKVVAELGPGKQLFTTLFFLHHGAQKVIVIEPKLSASFFEENLISIVKIFKENEPSFNLPLEQVRSRVAFAKDISLIDDTFNHSVDVILSHLVLEHVPSVDFLICHFNRLLTKTGFSFNMVDLTDHTYHFFSKYRLIAGIGKNKVLNHLKYSNKVFKWINDNKCYMNRTLFPKYLEYSKKYGLIVEVPYKNKFKKVKIHKDILNELTSLDEEDLYITSFHILFTKNKPYN